MKTAKRIRIFTFWDDPLCAHGGRAAIRRSGSSRGCCRFGTNRGIGRLGASVARRNRLAAHRKTTGMRTLGILVAIMLAGPSRSQVAAQCDQWQSIEPGLNLFVAKVATYKGKLIVAGDFNSDPDHPNWLAQWDEPTQTWQALGTGVNSNAVALQVYNDQLIVGGWFTVAGGKTVYRIAAWDGEAWHDLDGGMNAPVFDLVVFENELIASGWFTLAGGVEVNGIARWNGSSWQSMGEFDDVLSGFAVYDGQLYAGALFDVVRWNGSSWETFGAVPNQQIGPLTVYKGELVVGGAFTSMNGQSMNKVARWNGSAWRNLGSGFNGTVHSLTTYNGDLIASGLFESSAGQTVNGIARWNGSSWQPLGGGVLFGRTAGFIGTLNIQNADLRVGGTFDTAGGEPALNIAKWQDCDLCIADIVDDNQVNVDDLLAVISAWGACTDPQPWCPADIAPDIGNNDGVVNVDDLVLLIDYWGTCPVPPFYCLGDITDNNVVDVNDLLIVVNTWGPCPPPPPPPCPADIAPLETGGSGAVDVDDLLAVINAWGPCR